VLIELAFGGVVSALVGGAALAGLATAERAHVRRRLGVTAPPGKPQALGRFVARTGLDVTEGQAAAAVIVLAVVTAGVFYRARPDLGVVVLGLVVGAAVPLGILAALQSGRRRQVREAVPELLGQLARALRAGQTLEAGLTAAAADAPAPLAADLRQCEVDVRLGLSAAAAVGRLADRLRVPELDAMAAVTDAHADAGGDLAGVFDRLATAGRDATAARAQLRAATSLGRLSAGFVASAVPALLLYYWIEQPTFLGNFWSNPLGWKAVGTAVVLEGVGLAWVWRLLRTED